MATKKIKVEIGEGLPDENTKGEFYKDINSNTMYKKIEGSWVEKPIIPSVWNPIFKKYKG